MKNLTNYLILILAIVLTSCSTKKDSTIEKKAIITGKILNQNKYSDNYTIKVFEIDLVSSLGKYHTEFINDDGSFKIEFNKSFSSDVYLMYGNLITVFIGAGDSVYVEFDADEYSNANEENRYNPKSLKFSGSNEQINEEIKIFGSLINNKTKILEENNNEKTMLPEEYLSYIKKNKANQSHILDSLTRSTDCSKEFIKWANFEIDYRFASKLFHYTWFYPDANNKGKRNFEVIDIPESFYSSIKNIPINNEAAIINTNYFRFLHEYFLTNTDLHSEVFRQNIESRGKFAKSDSFQIAFEELLRTIKKDYKGIAYEILISQKLFSLMDSYKRLDVFETLYPNYENKLSHDFFNILYEKYSELKLNEQNSTKNENLSKQNNNIEIVANNILDEIIEKNKGKVLYIDFWATWCGPCLMEFENSKNVAKIFENKNIEFVYLCVKSEKENWEDRLREYKLSGNQYLLNDSEYDILSQKFQVVGIPHYVLIDKNGKVIDGNAPHPSNKDQLISLINRYID
jgi:thiol-disulfide isomerase/thioredoxin